jgi:hypothetical protein
MVDRIETIDDLAAFLTRKDSEPFNLFVGSTISCSSPAHAPAVEEIRKSLFDDLLEALDDSPGLRARVDTTLKKGTAAANRREGMPFESLWERVARVTGDDFVANVLVRLYTGGKPNVHHQAIAWLASQGLIRTVLTTNYDEYIERAFNATSSSTGWADDPIDDRDAMVLRRIPANLDAGKEFEVSKLHGTHSKPKTLAFMFPQITNGLSDETEALLVNLLRSAPVLFAGYGCNDWDLQSLLRTAVDSVWATHHGNWSSVEERCRSIAAHHRQTRWYTHDLKATPDDSVFVQLARFFGWTGSTTPSDNHDKPNAHNIVAECDRTTKLEILAELLDSLALRIASEVFAKAARHHALPRKRARLEVASFIALSHAMNTREQIEQSEKLPPRSDRTITEDAAIKCQLAFAHLIGGTKMAGLCATFRLLPIVWRLGREAATRDLLDAEKTWTSDDHLVAMTLFRAREVFAHNILRLAWFHVPGRLGIAVRSTRVLGCRRLLAQWARRMLRANQPWIARLRDLVSIASLERERVRTPCVSRADLMRRWSER